MRLAASLAILGTGVAAGLTIVAASALGEGVEAHPITRLAVAQVGWIGYLALSLAVVVAGIRLLESLPFAEWSVRVVALAKVLDATRDAWLVARHPAIDVAAVGETSWTLVAVATAVLVALLLVDAGLSFRNLDPQPAF